MTPFQTARQAEQLNRELAYFPKAPALCGFPVVPFTARHKLELRANGNAFLFPLGHPPLRGDVAELLWRLSPNFRRRDGSTPNHRDRFRRPPTALASWLTRRILFRRLRSMKFRLHAAILAIHARIEACHQDQPAPSNSTSGSELSAETFWLDEVTEHFCSACHWTPDEVLDAPLALLFQIYRQNCLSRGISIPFIAPSDALYGKDEAP